MTSLAPRRAVLCFLLLAGGCVTSVELGREALAQNDIEEAETLFRQALTERRSDKAAAREELTKILLKKASTVQGEDLDAAIVIYKEILDIDPNSDAARTRLARSLSNQKKYDDALALLDEKKDCHGCKMMRARVLTDRAHDHIENKKPEEARADFDQAFALGGDPNVLLEMTALYTVGQIGTAAEAAETLAKAQGLIKPNNAALQQDFVAKRQDVGIAAAAAGDTEGIAAILALDDPRANLPLEEIQWANFQLELAIADAEVQGGHHDSGIQRGKDMLLRAQDVVDETKLTELYLGVVGLYATWAAQDLAQSSSRSALTVIQMGLEMDPTNPTLLLQEVLAYMLTSSRKALKALSKIPQETPEYDRIRALYNIQRGHEYMKKRKMNDVLAKLARAEELAPDLPEVALLRARILYHTPLENVSKEDAKTFATMGAAIYPGGRIQCYGQSLAQIASINMFMEQNPAEWVHPLRGPGFRALLERIETDTRSFYPFDAELTGEEQPRLVLTTPDTKAFDVAVVGPDTNSSVTISLDQAAEIAFPQSGLVKLTVPTGDIALFLEPYTKITAGLSAAP